MVNPSINPDCYNLQNVPTLHPLHIYPSVFVTLYVWKLHIQSLMLSTVVGVLDVGVYNYHIVLYDHTQCFIWGMKYCFKFVELCDYREGFMKILHIQSVEIFISSPWNRAFSINVLKAVIVLWMNWVCIMRLTCIVLKGQLNKPLEWEVKWIYKLVEIQLASFF